MEGNQQAKVNPLERTIDMSVPMTEIEKEVEQRLAKLARTVKMPGFRPGKVPLRLVAQQYGPQARSEALGAAVEKAFGDAVRSQKLRVAGYPHIEPRQSEDQATLAFSATFEIYPEITLGDIAGTAIERPVLEVGDAEVDKTVEVLRKQRTVYEAADRPAQNGDRAVIDFVGSENGEPFQGGSGNDFPVLLGAGTMLADFESQLVGAKAGDTRNFDLTFPEDYHAKERAGKTVQFEVAVKHVEVAQLPELDGEFVKSMGVADGDLAKFREEVKANLEREVKKRIQARVKDQAMNALLEANPIDVPRALVSQEAEMMAENARHDLQSRGMDLAKMPVQAEWFGEQAERRVKLGLIVSEVVKAKELFAKPEQIRAVIDEFAQSYEDPAEVVRFYYGDRQRLAQVEAVVVEDNVVEWVVQNAKTTDKPTSFDDLMGNAA